MDGAQYWGGTPPPELTVGYLTTVVGAMGAATRRTWLLGSAKMPHNRFQFDRLSVARLSRTGVQPGTAARAKNRWMVTKRADRSVSLPSHWPAQMISPGIHRFSSAETTQPAPPKSNAQPPVIIINKRPRNRPH